MAFWIPDRGYSHLTKLLDTISFPEEGLNRTDRENEMNPPTNSP